MATTSAPTLTPEGLAAQGFDLSGLTADHVLNQDLEMLGEWWRSHEMGELPVTVLPPLGVLVSDAEGPAFALWCYEPYGVGVAFLSYPVSRPGLSRKRAANAAAFAVWQLTLAAGKAFEPEGEYRVFEVTTSKAIARILQRMGFVLNGAEWTNLILRN